MTTGLSPAGRGHLAMLAFSALVAGSFALGSRVANDISPSALNAMRFGLAAVVIGVAAVTTTGFRAEDARAPWRYLVLGGMFALYFVLMFEGLKTAPPVSAAAVFTLTPVLSALFGWVLLRQVTTGRMVLALAIGAAGALWVIFRADWTAARAFEVGRGEAIYFLGCVFHAVYTPMVRKLNRGESAVVFTFGTLVAGCGLLVVYSWSDLMSTDWAAMPTRFWVTLGYLAVFSSAATFVLLQYATLRLPAANVMAYTYLTPSWVLIWELGLGEAAPPPLMLVGVGLTICALLLLLDTRRGQSRF